MQCRKNHRGRKSGVESIKRGCRNGMTEINDVHVPREFYIYKNYTRTRGGVERNIEIIGEAINRIIRKDLYHSELKKTITDFLS